MGKLDRFLVVAGLVAGLASCAMLDSRPAPEIVKERAQARWNALVRGDVPAAYEYFSKPSKSVTSLEAYRNSIKPGFWKSVGVENVSCATSDSCDVQVTIEYEFGGSRHKTPARETWIREGRNWWYVHR